MEPLLGTDMWVATIYLGLSCTCNQCNNVWSQNYPVIAIKLTAPGELFDKPDIVECPTCHGWDTIVLIHSIKRTK